MSRPHADIIKAIADDEALEIEWFDPDTQTWAAVLAVDLLRFPKEEYRIKPKAKRKVEMWQWLLRGSKGNCYASGYYYTSYNEVVKDQSTGITVVQRLEWSRIEVEDEI